MAFAITIVDYGLRAFDWASFGLVSVLIQWVILSSAACICPLRPWFDQRGGMVAGVTSYAIVIGLTLFYSLLGHWIVMRDMFFDPFMVGGNVIVASILAGVMLRYFYLQQQLREQHQAELQARVQALQSRIRPHFLFNSMNSIASLIHVDPGKAEKLIVDLSTLFRASLSEASLVPLEQELELCRQFVSIEKIRLEKRLQVDWHVGEFDQNIEVPSLLIQPLIENAIYHGIQPLDDGGVVAVSVQAVDHRVSITIENPYSAEKSAMAKVDHANGMALENIRNRLSAHYGNAGELNVQTNNHCYRVTVVYPVIAAESKPRS